MSEIKILLVDDREENLVSIEAILDTEGYTFVRAGSGRDALKILLTNQDFNLILMDVKMPELSGLETASLIYQRDKLRHIPIIFITAFSHNEENIYEGYKAGAVDYIYKPIHPQLLKAKVAVFVDIYKKNHELKRLNSTLKKQSQYVRSIIESSQDPLATINSKGEITDMNDALMKITGLEREQLTGSYFFSHFTDSDKAKALYEEVFEKGNAIDRPLILTNSHGKRIEMLCNGSVFRDEEGKVLGVVIVAREKLLSKYSRGLIEASLDPLITISSDGKITDMNQALAKITGLSREDIIGTSFPDYFTEPIKANEVIKAVFEQKSIVDAPLTIRNVDGKLTEVLFNGSIYKDDKGLVQGAVIVARDVTAQRLFEKELIEAKSNAEREKRIAEEAVRSKQEFLSNMSHEIRTPMNAIIGFTKVLQKTTLNEKQAEYLNAIEVSGNTLIVLINDILDLAKVDAGMMTFEETPFRLTSSLSTMLQLVEPKIQEKNLELRKDYDKRLPEIVMGDPVRLHQVVLNLLSNAVKFTPEGAITLSVRLTEQDSDNATIEFSVSDTGIGIPEHEQQFIFDKFRQAAGTARLFGGTGLGLSIVKHLVQAQGGNIAVKSTVGKGSSFVFSLSFKKFKQELQESNQTDKNQETDISIENIRVLVVEDVKLNQLLFKTLLTEFGFEMDLATNGKIAIEKMGKEKYDIVLMDLHMPEMDGFETTEYIRKKLNSNIPIIALTADVTTADLEKCRQVGMNDYLAKPVDEKLLYRAIIKYAMSQAPAEKTSTGKSEKTGKHGNIINLDYIRQITRDDQAAMRKIMKTYIEEIHQLSDSLDKGISDADWDLIRINAHSLKSLLGVVGNNQQVKETVRTIESLARKKEGLNEMKELYDEVHTFCDLACNDIRKELHEMEAAG